MFLLAFYFSIQFELRFSKIEDLVGQAGRELFIGINIVCGDLWGILEGEMKYFQHKEVKIHWKKSSCNL